MYVQGESFNTKNSFTRPILELSIFFFQKNSYVELLYDIYIAFFSSAMYLFIFSTTISYF